MKNVVEKGSWKTEVGKFDRKLLRMKLESWAEMTNYNWSWKVTEEVGQFWSNLERLNEAIWYFNDFRACDLQFYDILPMILVYFGFFESTLANLSPTHLKYDLSSSSVKMEVCSDLFMSLTKWDILKFHSKAIIPVFNLKVDPEFQFDF